tara:strand:- start:49 stop:1143 length:1095 start_codon:yes stop_codon:yes gene_type:complete
MLTNCERVRYQRHLNLKEVGETGQMRLKSSSIAIVGAGGLAHPTCSYLAAAGIGRISLIDDDIVQLSNLQRQYLFSEGNIGEPKTHALSRAISNINPAVEVTQYNSKLVPTNALKLLKGHDIVIDCTDNFSARYLASNTALELGVPLVHGSIHKFEGQLAVFEPEGPCYTCLYPNPPHITLPTCSEDGVLGALPGIIGTLQAMEAIKAILKIGTSTSGRLTVYDALQLKFREFTFKKERDCSACGKGKQSKQRLKNKTDQPIIREVNWETIPDDDNNKSWKVIDIRKPEEMLKGFDRRSQNIPLSQILSNKHKLCKNQKLYLYCQTGQRSIEACKALFNQGFNQVYSIKGGLNRANNLCHQKIN